jgi:hypothetical protein
LGEIEENLKRQLADSQTERKLNNKVLKMHPRISAEITASLARAETRNISTEFTPLTITRIKLSIEHALHNFDLEKHLNCSLSLSLQVKAQRQEALRIQKEHQLIKQQQSMLNLQPFVTDVEVSFKDGKRCKFSLN